MRYRIDLISAGTVLAVVAVQLVAVLDHWPWYTLAGIILGLRYVSLVEHNHAHTGIFHLSPINEAFGWLCFLSNGIPLEFYRVHHVQNHHALNQRFDEGGTDWSSTFGFQGTRFPDLPIGKFYYVCTFPFITIASCLIALLRAPGSRALKRFTRSMLVVLVASIGLGVVNLNGFLLFFVIPWLICVFAHGFHNYDHHTGCSMTDPYNSANESLSIPYRLLGFNIGYHIEHHLRPSLHWSQLPDYHAQVRSLIPPERLKRQRIRGDQKN